MLDRYWEGMERKKKLKFSFSLHLPIIFLLPLTHPLGGNLFLSPVFFCLKIQDGSETFNEGYTERVTSKMPQQCRLPIEGPPTFAFNLKIQLY